MYMGKKLPSHVLKYLVLEGFQEGPSYGYEIVSRIEEATDGYWSPSYGTIYPLIQRLEKKGLLKPISYEEAENRNLDNGDRKYFEITDEGRKEITPEGNGDEHKQGFRDLIIGYMKIYENKYGKEALEELIEDTR